MKKGCCIILILALLGIGVCCPKPVWWIIQTDLGISTNLREAMIEAEFFEEHGPNGDGVDAAKMVMDEKLWKKVIGGLDNERWRQDSIPTDIQECVINDCMLISGNVSFMEIWNAMNEEDIYWFYLNRYSLRGQNGENLIEASPNYTFGLISAKRRAIYYLRSSS